MTSETGITVRYWAAAKAATGVGEESLPATSAITLAELVARVQEAHGSPRLGDVIAVCSVLIDEQPVGTRAPGEVQVGPGQTVDFLPPFAGG